MSKTKTPTPINMAAQAEDLDVETQLLLAKSPVEMTGDELDRATKIMSFMAARATYAAAVTPAGSTRAQESELDPRAQELRDIELETAYLLREQAQETNSKIKETKEQRKAKRIAALRNMKAEEKVKTRTRAACRHMVGGKGLADMLRGGKDGSAVICTSYPFMGMKLYICSRCGDESITPSPLLAETDPAAYAEAMKKHEKFEELFAISYNSTEIGTPSFAFTQRGMPVHPDMAVRLMAEDAATL